MISFISHFFIGGLPAVLIFSCFSGYRKRALDAQKLSSGIWREAALHLFVLCLFGLAALLLWPSYRWEESDGLWGNLVILNGRLNATSNMNLVPFRMIVTYMQRFTEGDLPFGATFLLGNIAVFIPLGFFIPLLFRGQSFKRVLLIGLGYSLTAEVLQFFLGRHCDVDDVLLNVIGTLGGYALFLLLKRKYPAFVERFYCREIK